MARHECQRRSLCTPAVRSTGLCEAQTTTCEGVFGTEASNKLIGGRVLPRRHFVAPSDRHTPLDRLC